MIRNSYVLLDRDGTMIKHFPYLSNHELVEFVPGLVQTLQTLVLRGYRLGVVSNQSGVNRGLISYRQLLEINSKIVNTLGEFQVRFEFVRVCPHTPESNCGCRKPQTKLISDFIEVIDPKNSYMVGDSVCDIDFAVNLNMTPITLNHNLAIYKNALYASDFSQILNLIN